MKSKNFECSLRRKQSVAVSDLCFLFKFDFCCLLAAIRFVGGEGHEIRKEDWFLVCLGVRKCKRKGKCARN